MLRNDAVSAFILSCLILSAPATAKPAEKADQPVCTPAKTKTAASDAAAQKLLHGKSVYIYDFLDIREDQYRDQVLTQIETQLSTCLTLKNVSSTTIRSKATPYYSAPATGWEAGMSAPVETRMIPVADIIFSNLQKERDANADYRLIVFPSNFELQGAWRYYEIRWVLFDTKTSDVIWEYMYTGRHMVWMKESENSAARGRKVIQSAVEEMTKRNLL